MKFKKSVSYRKILSKKYVFAIFYFIFFYFVEHFRKLVLNFTYLFISFVAYLIIIDHLAYLGKIRVWFCTWYRI